MNDLEKLIILVNTLTGYGSRAAHPLAGRYVVVRSDAAGVHAGTFVDARDGRVLLSGARRLWQWQGAGGIALSGVAVHGIVASGCRVDSRVELCEIGGCCEILAADGAQASIEAVP